MKEHLILAMLVLFSTEAAVGCADGGACAAVFPGVCFRPAGNP